MRLQIRPSGKIQARKPSEEDFAGHVGFYSEGGIDAPFDEAMHYDGFPTIEISYPRATDGIEIKWHWDLGTKLDI